MKCRISLRMSTPEISIPKMSTSQIINSQNEYLEDYIQGGDYKEGK